MSLALSAVTGRSHTLPRDRGVATWLFVVCLMLLVMVALGGATRLTGSGLSIMEWDPLMGAIPPLSDQEWQRLFALYRAIPQYEIVNRGMDLAGFQSIFWLEWSHRLWGRLLGVVFLVPLVTFAVRGRIGRVLALRLAGLFVLGGLQGAVGWFMVASGFEDGSTSVSAGRLVAHLALALILYAAILWTALDLWAPPRADAPPGFRRLLFAICALVLVTIIAGGFVAGLHAGLIYNTFPLMGGRLVAPDYAAMQPFLRNWFQNPAAAQFDHRLLATLTALTITVAVAVGWQRAQPAGRPALAVLGAALCLQYALGVTTLLLAVPVWAGTLHQAVAVLLLSASMYAVFVHRAAHP